MGEGDAKSAVVIAPLVGSLASLPFHGVRLHPIDRSETHLIQFTLLCHTFHCKCQRFAILHSLYIEIEPSAIMTDVCIRKPITIHIACEEIRVIFGLFAL